MNVRISRKEHSCSFSHCCINGRKIDIGSTYVGLYFRKKTENRVRVVYLYYHPDCYVQSELAKIDTVKREVIELESKIRGRTLDKISKVAGKVGRPRKYSDPLQARNLTMLLAYHRKMGNDSKIMELEAKLGELRIY